MGGDICTLCCGTEREQTVHCPFECPYLQESRIYKPAPIASQSDFPNADIRVTEQFLEQHQPLLIWLTLALMRAALESPEVVDNDIKAALEGLVRTYRTMQSGLVYDSRPDNLIAAAVFERMKEAVDEIRQRLAEKTGMQNVRDADVLGCFVFLQRLEIQFNNGRRLGRAFIDHLRSNFPAAEAPAEDPSRLIV